MNALALAPIRRHVAILGPNGYPLPPSQDMAFHAGVRNSYRRGLRAGYDGAKTTNDNQRHWSQADALSADAAANPSVRRILRNRARYEAGNNGFCGSMIQRLANFTVGYGPRLRMQFENEATNVAIQAEWEKWAAAIRLARKLRIAVMARCGDGEAFGLMTTNPRIPHPVTLDLALFEADRVTEPSPQFANTRNVDGILLDEYGNTVSYKVLKDHPGGANAFIQEAAVYPAEQVIHLFRPMRAEQHRGISEITPALPLFGQLRDYRWAVGEAAKMAAQQSGWIYTDNPGEEVEEGEAFESVEVNHNTWNVAPYGYKAMQIKSEQPSTGYDTYVTATLGEIGAVLEMPYILVAGSAAKSNMASARFDMQPFYLKLDVDRDELELQMCDRLLRAWWDEAYLRGLLPPGVGLDLPHIWMWPPYPEPDLVAAAQSFEIRRRNGVDTIKRFYGREGQDSAQHIADWKAEVKDVPIPGASSNSAQGPVDNRQKQETAP